MRPTKKSGEILQKYVELAEELNRLPNSLEVYSTVSERQVRKIFQPEFGDTRKPFQILTELAAKKYPHLLPKRKVLLLDIETAPMTVHAWQLWDVNVGLKQIQKDWHLLSWAAKWLGDPESKMIYMDQRNAKSVSNDKTILKGMWDLLQQADVVITQNGKKFDAKKLNARFVTHEMPPPKIYEHLDTKLLAQKYFAFPSYSLEYMANLLCKKYKKLKDHNFAGHTLWTECLNGNLEAWKEMERYNKYDVLTLEELYLIFHEWDKKAIKLLGPING